MSILHRRPLPRVAHILGRCPEMARAGVIAATFMFLLTAMPLCRAQEPGTPEWDRMQNNAARDAVRLDALRSRSGDGVRGGCNTLPAGWARLDAVVDFPAEYRGYPAWVNSAELLPVGSNLKAYLAHGDVPGAYVRPALHDGMRVSTRMCAPGGRSYWLIVDSGMARVAIGQVRLGAPGSTTRVTMTAPPLHK
jgi:hypothetical protein